MAEEVTHWVVQGDIYLDDRAQLRIPTPIGLFESKDEAEMFMWKLRPFYGNWEYAEVHSPFDVSRNVDRPDAGNFLEARIRADHVGIQTRADAAIQALVQIYLSGDDGQQEIIRGKLEQKLVADREP